MALQQYPQSLHPCVVAGLVNNHVMRVGVPPENRLTLGRQEEVVQEVQEMLTGCVDSERAAYFARFAVERAEQESQ